MGDLLKSYSSSSASHKNQKNNNASITLNPKPVAKTRKGTKGPVHICNIYASWIMIIRRMNPYEIFLGEEKLWSRLCMAFEQSNHSP
jgi:hypothetical protein